MTYDILRKKVAPKREQTPEVSLSRVLKIMSSNMFKPS